MEKKDYYITVQSEMLGERGVSPRAKLLYGYIVSLSRQKGYCFATNKYLAMQFGVCRKTITRDLKELSRAKYVETRVGLAENGNRLRYIVPLLCPTGKAHPSHEQGTASPTPRDNRVSPNNKRNKKNNLSYESKFLPKFD